MRREVKDMLIDADSYDLIIANGDLKAGDSTFQHQQHLLMAAKGDYKLTPDIGVDAMSQLHSSSNTLARDARIEFIRDGMTVNKIYAENQNIIFDAYYSS